MHCVCVPARVRVVSEPLRASSAISLPRPTIAEASSPILPVLRPLAEQLRVGEVVRLVVLPKVVDVLQWRGRGKRARDRASEGMAIVGSFVVVRPSSVRAAQQSPARVPVQPLLDAPGVSRGLHPTGTSASPGSS